MSFCGLDTWINRNIKSLKYSNPTKIQSKVIPYILNNTSSSTSTDLIAISKTGTGKTASFCLPILNELAKDPTSIYAIILEPTRELALQVIEKLSIYSIGFNLRTSLIIGGEDYIKQLHDLDKSPHIIVATPGRLADLISNDKVSLIENVKFFVLDEFDQLLNETIRPKVGEIVKYLPDERCNLLFSATYECKYITSDLLSCVLNKDMRRVNVIYENEELFGNSNDCKDSNEYDNIVNIDNSKEVNKIKPIIEDNIESIIKELTVSSLSQKYLLVPPTLKELYLIRILNTDCKSKSIIIFVQTCRTSQILYELLLLFNFKVSTIHSKLNQSTRFSDFQKFKSNKNNILVATDLACRGLDIPHVEYVINFDLPRNPIDYIHRVGRTARAGRSGTAISFVSPSDVELILEIEKFAHIKMSEVEFNEDEAMKLLNSVSKGKKMILMKIQDNKRLDEDDKRRKRFK